MSGPQNIVLGNGVRETLPPDQVEGLRDMLVEVRAEGAVGRAGFDPHNVGTRSVTIHYTDQTGQSGSREFILFVPDNSENQDAGIVQLRERGYYRVEVTEGDRVIAGYLSPEQYMEYTALQPPPSEASARDAADRLLELSGPAGESRRRHASAAIVTGMIFLPACPDPKYPGRTRPERLYEPHMIVIDSTAPKQARQDAEAILRERNLVPHRIQGDKNVYWMRQSDWDIYDRDVLLRGGPRRVD